ncbi:hypothetical protein P280DRAFT_310434 [Massarina eburnea CBS 473.64]|uniref:Uncharacterized protein n=1 Tax=Massarina eburnea CBS 473.64 TaxID=1395130 RepID=A0A6A6S1H1_9PLEO|nr:hypothetical protein P280DRAFT_310434 [Massarina eburnea CBS 473.64]
MRPVRSGSTFSSNARPSSIPSKVPQHKKSLSEASLKGHAKSRNSLHTSQSTDSRLTTCSETTTNGGRVSSSDSIKASIGLEALQPSPLIVAGKPRKKIMGETAGSCRDQNVNPPAQSSSAWSKQVEELKATITAQDQTISTLQAQFAGLRASHETHVATLAEAHAAEVASLKNYAKALEEQQQQRSLHHASSNHLLFLLDTTDLQSPNKTSPRTVGSNPTATTRASRSLPDSPSLRPSPRRGPLTPEMEHLKRRLTTTRRPEIDDNNLIRERDKYRNNCQAFEEQIVRLTGRLNQVKDERDDYAKVAHNLEFAREELVRKASRIEQLEKNSSALQNTIDHLEHRLELANVQKLDAEEQLHNWNTQKSPFDVRPTKRYFDYPLNDPQSLRTSAATVFSDDSPLYRHPDLIPTDLAPFIARIERLQEQIHQDDLLKAERGATGSEASQQIYDRAARFREIDTRNLRLKATIADLKDNSAELAQRLRQKDERNEQLQRSVEILQETLEKRCVSRAKFDHLSRQLSYRSELLEKEIKKNATLSMRAHLQPHQDLLNLVTADEISRWLDQIESKLIQGTTKHKSGEGHDVSTKPDGQDLRNELDFLVREIIYYKLDVRHYKSDVKKLRKELATMQQQLRRSKTGDVESLHPPPDSSSSPGRRDDDGVGGVEMAVSSVFSPGAVSIDPQNSPSKIDSPVGESDRKYIPANLDRKTSVRPMTPSPAVINVANRADNIDPGISPRSMLRLSPERRKPTPPSPDEEKFGDMTTKFPLSTPAAPVQIKRPVGEASMVRIGPKKADASQPPALRLDVSKAKATPERPPRPSVGLFEAPVGEKVDAAPGVRSSWGKNVIAEAMRNSPGSEHGHAAKQFVERRPSNSSTSSAHNHLPSETTKKEEIRASTSTNSSNFPSGTLSFRSRENSLGSFSNMRPSSADRDRRASTSSSANTPFVIGMGSPHNPAFNSPIIAPVAPVLPAACSITRNGCIRSPPVRTGGVGGTIVSTTPVNSPTTTENTRPAFFAGSSSAANAPKKSKVSPPLSRGGSISAHSRSKSVAHDHNQAAYAANVNADFGSSIAAPTTASSNRSRTYTPLHSRNMSGNSMSIRNAINLPGKLDFIKGMGKQRKSSISNPQPLGNLFDIDRVGGIERQRPEKDGRKDEGEGKDEVGQPI